MLNTWGKTHPAQTKMQSLVWPALAREIDVVAIDETKSGSHLDFLPPLLFKFHGRGVNRGRGYKQRDPVACIIAPNFETIAAVQRGHDRCVLAKYRFVCWSVDQSCSSRQTPMPRHLYGREAEAFQWECRVNAGCDIVVCTSSSFLELSASGILPTKSLEHLIVLEPNAAWNDESQLHSVMSSVASTVSICVFCDAWSPVVERIVREHCKSPVLVSNPCVTSATATSAQTIREAALLMDSNTFWMFSGTSKLFTNSGHVHIFFM